MMNEKRMKKAFGLWLTVLLLFCMLTGCAQPTAVKPSQTVQALPSQGVQEEPLVLAHFIDVGQGDCILLCSAGQTMLIDAGTNQTGADALSYLQALGLKTLDIVVGTHPHEDHIGGLDTVINAMESVGKVYMPKITANTKTYEDVLTAIAAKGLKITVPKAGTSFAFGHCTVEILAPVRIYESSTNDNSIVLRVIAGDTAMLFTGDAEIQSENDILASGAAVKSDLLKVGHHGSSTSTGEEFFKAISPSVTVIMCGKDNSYGHPHKETLQTLQNTELWRTDLQGTIVAQSDGKSLKLSAAVQPPQQEAAYIGNKKSNVFHLPSCASLPAEVNRVYFSDRQQAVDAGMKPCGSCKP